NVIGIARLYAATLDHVLDIMENTPIENGQSSRMGWRKSKNGPATAQLRDRLAPETPCPVCEALAEFEQEYTGIFSRYLNDDRFQTAFRQSEGVCLPHLRQILAGLDAEQAR